MQICVLGSGSGGNCTLVRLGEQNVLIDMGFGPRATSQRLAGTGVGVGDIGAALLTHLDRDHFRPTWLGWIERQRITVHCHRRHLHALYAHPASGGVDARLLHRRGLIRVFDDEPFELTIHGGVAGAAHPLHLAHDCNGTVGFRIESPGGWLGYATDLGRVPASLPRHFADVDILAIESNYDPPMQRASTRPAMLKRRIMGGRGHLSNEQARQLIRGVFERSMRPPRHVVLLHLSRQCNDPHVVRRLYLDDAELSPRLCITAQGTRTDWLAASDRAAAPLTGRQWCMFT